MYKRPHWNPDLGPSAELRSFYLLRHTDSTMAGDIKGLIFYFGDVDDDWPGDNVEEMWLDHGSEHAKTLERFCARRGAVEGNDGTTNFQRSKVKGSI